MRRPILSDEDGRRWEYLWLAGLDKFIEKRIVRQPLPRHADRLVHEHRIELLPDPDVGGLTIEFSKSFTQLIFNQCLGSAYSACFTPAIHEMIFRPCQGVADRSFSTSVLISSSVSHSRRVDSTNVPGAFLCDFYCREGMDCLVQNG